jgi:dihydrofolate reductase
MSTSRRTWKEHEMRKLVVVEFLSLDGVYQGPGDPDEDREGGFEQGGWQLPFGDEMLGAAAGEGMAATDTHLFGRKTYEVFAAYWPNAPADDPFAKHLNPVEKYVASRTLRDLTWQNSRLIEGDVPTFVRELKARPGGNISVLGSGGLVQTLIANDLVDEYSLAVFPIVLGSGKRLFRDAAQPLRLELVDSKTTGTGGLLLTYRPAR